VSPDDEVGNFEPTNLNKTIQQQQLRSQSIEEDQQMLLDIEQNIANLEKSLNQGTLSTIFAREISVFLIKV
jgi:hypothetical protein